MASKSGGGMHHKTDRKTRGRTSISGTVAGGRPGDDIGPSRTKPNVPEVRRAETNRPVTAGGGKHRGDRRDMSPTYTGNVKHKARGNTPRTDVKTRKR